MKKVETKSFIVEVDNEGRVMIPEEIMQDRLINPGEKYKLSVADGYFILLKMEEKRKETDELSEKDIELREKIGKFLEMMVSAVHISAEEKSKIQFKGDIATVGISDILMFLNAAKKTGVLFLELEKAKKVFFMVSGEIYIALSTKPEEHLLEMFKKRKKISRMLVDKIQKQAEEENKDINTVILENREISTDVLMQVIRYQLEESIYDLFMEKKGSFSFIDEDPPANTDIFIPISLTNLVMEGARRIDEWSRIRKEIDSMDIVFEKASNRKDINLEPDELVVLDIVDGEKTIADIVEASGIDKFEAVHILYGLLSTNSIRKKEYLKSETEKMRHKPEPEKTPKKEPVAEEKTEPSAVPEPREIKDEDLMEYTDIINQYNNIFSTIYESVKFAIGEGASVVLGTFFKGLDQDAVFKDVNAIEEDGTLDANQILENLTAIPKGQRRQILTDSLNELLYSQLFAVKNTIGTEMEQAILNIIKTQLKR